VKIALSISIVSSGVGENKKCLNLNQNKTKLHPTSMGRQVAVDGDQPEHYSEHLYETLQRDIFFAKRSDHITSNIRLWPGSKRPYFTLQQRG